MTRGDCVDNSEGGGVEGNSGGVGGVNGSGDNSSTASVEGAGTSGSEPNEDGGSDGGGIDGGSSGGGSGGGASSEDGGDGSTDEHLLDVSRMPVASLFPNLPPFEEEATPAETVTDSAAELDVEVRCRLSEAANAG